LRDGENPTNTRQLNVCLGLVIWYTMFDHPARAGDVLKRRKKADLANYK
jgi:hypothetical protein